MISHSRRILVHSKFWAQAKHLEQITQQLEVLKNDFAMTVGPQEPIGYLLISPLLPFCTPIITDVWPCSVPFKQCDKLNLREVSFLEIPWHQEMDIS